MDEYMVWVWLLRAVVVATVGLVSWRIYEDGGLRSRGPSFRPEAYTHENIVPAEEFDELMRQLEKPLVHNARLHGAPVLAQMSHRELALRLEASTWDIDLLPPGVAQAAARVDAAAIRRELARRRRHALVEPRALELVQ